MKNKSIVPKIRFSISTDAWVKREISEMAKLGRGVSKHRPRDASHLYGGPYPFIQTGDIRNSELYITDARQSYSEAGLKQSKLWEIDTLCVTIAANIAETAILKIKACFPDSVIGIVPKESETTSLFLKYQFENFQTRIKKLSQGVAQENLNLEKLSTLTFNFPNFQEQQKIASFLSTVDEKIQLLKKQQALLEKYKKGIIKMIFSCELRFKDENGKDFPQWREAKLQDVVTKQSSNISANKIELNFGEFILYGAAGVWKKIDFYEIESDYISVVKDGAGVGRLLYCKGKSSVLGTLEILKPIASQIDTRFAYYLLSTIDFSKYVTGSTIPHIYFRDYQKEKVRIPVNKEQQKIASFLTSIDEKIDNCKEQIRLTEEWKKGLLQQLFV